MIKRTAYGRRRWLLGLVVAVVGLTAGGLQVGAQGGGCGWAGANPVACENLQAGNPASEWDVTGIGDPSIQGFATDISVDQGQTVRFKVSTPASAYRIDIYRLGYYNGNGARKVATVLPTATLPQTQPACLSDPTTGLVDCGNWTESASWAVPSTATSGIYIARLVRTDTGGASHMVFIVRDDDGGSALLFQTSDTTWQAYNSYGGNSLYTGSPAGRAYKVSYNRPFNNRPTPNGPQESWLFNAEYPMVRWLEANGYDVSYTTGVDTDRRGAELLEHRVFMSVGHDEYWSGQQRTRVEAARDAGVHLAFFSGNEVFWKTRWENSIATGTASYRTLVSYKETHDNAKIDPTATWTGTWRDPRFSPPSDGGRPENALTGQLFMVNAPRNDAIAVPAAQGKMRFWRNTSIANLTTGQTATLPAGTLGYEWDEVPDNGWQPAGLMRLSSTTINVSPVYLQDYGTNYGNGIATHSLTLYRANSGALVFGAGTVQWSWGLDANHDRAGTPADGRMRQATVNLFADMGVQPFTPEGGIVTSPGSTDTVAPTSTISSPANGANVAGTVAISGTASDTGGGLVAAVDVSVDNGVTWHSATGTTSWTYSWTPTQLGSVHIRTRSVDDTGNVETPGAGITVTVTSSCPCRIWPSAPTPGTPSNNDSSAVELGVRFKSDIAGYITALRFYKGPQNSGTHTGHLWMDNGTLLATATFTNETSTGWQQVALNPPVAIVPNATYVASYFAPNGGYSIDRPYFATNGIDAPPLHAVQDTLSTPNGVYLYGESGFPTSTYQSANYWVDVVFDTTSGPDTTPPTVISTSPVDGAVGVAAVANVTAMFSEAINPTTVSTSTFELRTPSNTLVAATVSYDSSSRVATLDPTAALAFNTTYRAILKGSPSSPAIRDAAGNALAATVEWTFSTGSSSGCPCRIWPGSPTPGTPSNNDTQSVELGVRFRSDVDGFINGVRFYKGPSNTGTHVGHLWTNGGTLLASATFTGESASGWQEVTFGVPVAVQANVTYVASYYAPNGGYALDQNYFAATGVDTPPLHALQNGVDGGNGVYRYGTGGGFPSSTYLASNYWVDVVFAPGSDTTPPSVTATSPISGASGVALDTNVTATFSEPIDPATISTGTFELRNAANALVSASVTYNSSTRTATLDPAANLTASATYKAILKGGATSPVVRDVAGNALPANVEWTFVTTAGPGGGCPCRIWPSAPTPGTPSNNDPNAVELGVRFRSDVDGYIKSIRFYKGPSNTGTHLAHLWTNTGTLLASATFSNETATGWQEVTLASPVAIQANVVYVASYYAPNGGYAIDRPFFATSGVDAPPLHALQDGSSANGIYKYGPSGFPTSTYQSANYWVDVVFTTTP